MTDVIEKKCNQRHNKDTGNNLNATSVRFINNNKDGYTEAPKQVGAGVSRAKQKCLLSKTKHSCVRHSEGLQYEIKSHKYSRRQGVQDQLNRRFSMFFFLIRIMFIPEFLLMHLRMQYLR